MALTAVQLFINNVIISQENSCKISSQIGFLNYKKSYKTCQWRGRTAGQVSLGLEYFKFTFFWDARTTTVTLICFRLLWWPLWLYKQLRLLCILFSVFYLTERTTSVFWNWCSVAIQWSVGEVYTIKLWGATSPFCFIKASGNYTKKKKAWGYLNLKPFPSHLCWERVTQSPMR